jgi:hypothetical protein
MALVAETQHVHPSSNPGSLPIVQAEPISVFHFEVLTVSDHKVAGLTTQLLYASACLILIAIINFALDIGEGSLSLSSAIMNLLVALSLPACGIIGVRDKNITCIKYFCCCTYFCAFLTFISIIGYIVLVASGKLNYLFRLILVIFFFMVYVKGGSLSQKLQEQPYFTQERLAPRSSYSVHQNTVEYNPQPTAHAEFAPTAAVHTPPSGNADHTVITVNARNVPEGDGPPPDVPMATAVGVVKY